MALKLKTSFNSLDIATCVHELQRVVGYRVDQVYDVDDKTYMFKLRRGDDKGVLLMEAGVRIHLTKYEWQKNAFPSNFAMKLRKHVCNRRIDHVSRIGRDRIIDIQVGSGEVAHHIILELFNKGNIILTDSNWLILRVLRPHSDGDQFKLTIREQYPIARAQQHAELPDLQQVFDNARKGHKLMKILLPYVDYGPSLLEHLLLLHGFEKDAKYNGHISARDLQKIKVALEDGIPIMSDIAYNPRPAYIIKYVDEIEGQTPLSTYIDVQPYLFMQHASMEFDEFPDFLTAVDEYFSQVENSKIQHVTVKKQREATDKVKKIKADQHKRMEKLVAKQSADVRNAELILANSDLLDQVITLIRQAVAAQMQWEAIKSCIAELHKQKNPIGLTVDKLKLEINHVTVSLNDPCDHDDNNPRKVSVDLDLALSAHGNATRYYSNSKSAALKEKKTVDAQQKAMKSVEQKAKVILKDVKKSSTMNVVRKPLWFEKFYWFISSDNYLVIGGRDHQQNELIVKRYMKQGDIYVHADIHGASTIVIKNPEGDTVPPRTLEEAGCMAVCYSAGWEAKVINSAWWVYGHQVSKTAPSGEYLSPGSFMIRGTRNPLLPAQLCMGLTFMFKLDESSAMRHRDERKPKSIESSSVLLEETKSATDIDESAAPRSVVCSLDKDTSNKGVIHLDDEEDEPETNVGDASMKDDTSGLKFLGDKDFVLDPSALSDDDIYPDVKLVIDEDATINEEGLFDFDDYSDAPSSYATTEQVLIGKSSDLESSSIGAPSSYVTEQVLIGKSSDLESSIGNLNPVYDESSSKASPADTDTTIDDNLPAIFAPEDAPIPEELIFPSTSDGDVTSPHEPSSTTLYLRTDLHSQGKTKKKSKDKPTTSTSGDDKDQGHKIRGKHSHKSRSSRPSTSSNSDSIPVISTKHNVMKPIPKESTNNSTSDESDHQNQPLKEKEVLKRGQRSKQKKIKEKYKHQDEEERSLRMAILKPDGEKRVSRKEKKNLKKKVKLEKRPNIESVIKFDDSVPGEIHPRKETSSGAEPLQLPEDKQEEFKKEEFEQDEEASLMPVLDIIDQLTGQPLPDDEFLYALPVIAPYTALTKYKYKVKLTPGTAPRGKAAKSAIQYIMNQRENPEKEKILIRKIPMDQLCLYFPGKVKLNILKGKK